MAEDRRPVLVGVAQWTLRDAEPASAPQPLEMLEKVSREAAEDAAAGARALRELDTVAAVSPLGWAPQNPAALLAGRLGAQPACQLVTATGGEGALHVLNHVAGQIARGDSRAALLASAHNIRTRRLARREGVELHWESGGGGAPEVLGRNVAGSSAAELAYELMLPIHVYPLFENALRARRGLDVEAHRLRMGALFSRFTEQAARNPHAWFPVERSAEHLTTVTPENRMVAYPYTKYLNAIMATDQAAAVLLMSADAARAYGVPEERWVYWSGGAHGQESAWFPSERPDLAACPALRATATRALACAGTRLEEIDLIDLYSCFPSAVSMACEMLGLAEDDPRGFTVTGGLPYGGGPGNGYALHATASMVERLREKDEGRGLLTGIGWYLTKHSASVLSREPLTGETLEAREVAGSHPSDSASGEAVPVLEQVEGKADVLSYTVLYDREGAPRRGIVIGKLVAGGRFVANTPGGRNGLDAWVTRDAVGCSGRVSRRGSQNVFELD